MMTIQGELIAFNTGEYVDPKQAAILNAGDQTS